MFKTKIPYLPDILHKGSDYVRMMMFVVLFLWPTSTSTFAGRLPYHGVTFLAELGGSLAKRLYALVTYSPSGSNVR